MAVTTLTPAADTDACSVQRGGKVPPTYDVDYAIYPNGPCGPGRATADAFSSTDYSAQNALIRFPTYTLGPATVSAANLILRFQPSFLFQDNLLALFIETYNAFDGSLAYADWTDFSTANVGTVAYADLLNDVDLTIPVDPALLDMNGSTTFRLHLGAVWGSPATTMTDQMYLYDWNDPAGPRLELTYTPILVPATSQCPLVGDNAVCVVTLDFSDPLIEDYVNGTVYVSLSHPCAYRTATDPIIGAVGTQRVPVNLGPNAQAVMNLIPSASLCPMDGFPQSDVYYIFTMPDGKELRGAVPDQPSIAFQSLTWRA